MTSSSLPLAFTGARSSASLRIDTARSRSACVSKSGTTSSTGGLPLVASSASS